MKQLRFKFKWIGHDKIYPAGIYDVDMLNFVTDKPFITVAFRVKGKGVIARSDEGELIQVKPEKITKN